MILLAKYQAEIESNIIIFGNLFWTPSYIWEINHFMKSGASRVHLQLWKQERPDIYFLSLSCLANQTWIPRLWTEIFWLKNSIKGGELTLNQQQRRYLISRSSNCHRTCGAPIIPCWPCLQWSQKYKCSVAVEMMSLSKWFWSFVLTLTVI